MLETKTREQRALATISNKVDELHVMVERMQEVVLKELRAQKPSPSPRKETMLSPKCM
jgi:hypothetical protein